MIRKVLSIFVNKVLSLFTGVNPGVTRLIVGGFFIIAIPLLGMTIVSTVEFESYNTQFISYYFPDDPVSKGEFDQFWSLYRKQIFYQSTLAYFTIGYISLMLFSLWVWQGFQTKKETAVG